ISYICIQKFIPTVLYSAFVWMANRLKYPAGKGESIVRSELWRKGGLRCEFAVDSMQLAVEVRSGVSPLLQEIQWQWIVISG
ncbi:MAG: hypothetical protein Q8919_09990, partial [Bacteroidota bacterium]|nr:hypothetical protein [Bacteroidota bacterium]